MSEIFNEDVLVRGNLKIQTTDGNTDLTTLSEDGRVLVGDDLGLATPDALIEAHRDEGSTDKPRRGIHSLGRVGDLLSDAVSWVVSELELLGSDGVSGLHTALRSRLTQANSGSEFDMELRAGDFEVINQTGDSSTPSGKAVGVQAAVTNQIGGYLDEAVGVNVAIHNEEQSSAVTKAYGVYVEDIDEAEDNYAIYTGAGKVHFGDAVGINATQPDASAILDVRSTSRGVLMPRMTEQERDNISSPATGLIVYNTTSQELNVYDGSDWVEVGSGGSDGWQDPGAIGTTQLADLAVTTAKIAAEAVTSAKIGTGAVAATNLASDSVTEIKIQDGAVTANKLGTDAVTTTKINNLAVTEGKIAAGAVTDAKLGDNAVTTVKIEDSAVTTNKINNLAVSTGKLADLAVTAAKIAANAVGLGKLAVGTANRFYSTDGSGTAVLSKSVPSGDVVGTTDAQTLTNKTLSAPVYSNNGTGILNIDNLRLDANTISSTNTNGHILLTPNGTGNVGIKNTNPLKTLDVTGQGRFSSTGNIYLAGAAIEGAGGLELQVISNVAHIRHHDPGVAWRHIAINSEGGNVGIGISSPTSKLHVSGDTNITGALTVSGMLSPNGGINPIYSARNQVTLANNASTTIIANFPTNATYMVYAWSVSATHYYHACGWAYDNSGVFGLIYFLQNGINLVASGSNLILQNVSGASRNIRWIVQRMY